MVGDKNRHLIELRGTELTAHPLQGIAAGLDLEGIACGANDFLISTESTASERPADIVLRIDANSYAVIEEIELKYPSGVRGQDNEGLEGICLANGRLYATGEIIRKDEEGRRLAPLLFKGAEAEADNLQDLRLDLELYTVERHFGVHRLVHYTVSSKGVGHRPPLAPNTIVFLEGILKEKENFEGIVVDKDGVVTLINDNHYGEATGPTELTTLQAIPALARSK
jgi:hypothetical protein